MGIAPDLFFERYGPREEKHICWRTIGVLCVVIVGFFLFFIVYTSIWKMMLPTLTDYGLDLISLGLIFGVILVIYIVRNKSPEKRKTVAAS